VTHILVTQEIENMLEDLILEKTEGIPFFIENFIKSFKDLKIIERKQTAYGLSKGFQRVTIPSTIQEVIMARVDSLPEGAKEVLQIGSVIEREFSCLLINRLAGLPEQQLLSHLSVLKDSELLYERGIYPQSNYIFKHALIRELVYDSILAKRKKRLHEEIGKAIEELYKDNLSEYYEVLSEHYYLSENYWKSAEHSRFAARKAEKAASFNNAIAYAKKRVASLERLTQTADVEKQIIDARTILGLYTSQMNCLVEAKNAVGPIIDLALKHNYKKRLCQIYTILGAYYWFVEDNYPEAFKAFEQALKITEEITDFVSFVLASNWFGCALGWNCEFEKSANYFQRALDVNVAVKSLWGMSIINSNISFFCHWLHGRIDLQFKLSNEGLQIAEESGDIYSRAIAYVSHGTSCYGKGLLEEAEKYLLEGLEFCEKINLLAWDGAAECALGDIYCEMGDFQRSKEHYEKGIWAGERNRLFPSWVGWAKVGSTMSKVKNKEKDVNLESLYFHSRNNKIKILDGWIQRYIGEILLSIDDQHMSEAEHWIENAIETDQRNRMMFHLGKDYAVYSEILKRKGERAGAHENLVRATEILKECGADGWVKKYEEETAKLT
jgi:tetratricopeptide (TPR) repeat protein